MLSLLQQLFGRRPTRQPRRIRPTSPNRRLRPVERLEDRALMAVTNIPLEYSDTTGVESIEINPPVIGEMEIYDYPGDYLQTTTPQPNTPGPDDDVRQPPAVWAGNDVTIVEGQTFDQSGVFTAGGGAWTVTVDYGDGSGEQPLKFNADKSFSLNHTYTDDGIYTVTVKVTDDQGEVGTDSLIVTATDALPHIGGAVISPSLERQNATLQVAVDPTNPNDQLTLTINWG